MHASPLRATRSRRRSRGRGAYTLVELLVSAASMAVLVAGVSSAVLLAMQTIEDGESRSEMTRRGIAAADMFFRDLDCATTYVQVSPGVLSLTVPDRDGDAQDESILYEWSGDPNAPFTRQVNGGDVETVLEGIQGLFVVHHTAIERFDDPNDGSTDILLASYEGVENISTIGISQGQWIGQCFLPSLPADATSWSVTRVQFHALRDMAYFGSTRVQLRPDNGSGVPSSTVLDEVTLSEYDLDWSGTDWTEVAFSGASGLSPDQGLCLVLKWESDPYYYANSCAVHYQTSGASPSGSHMVKTTDGGSSWTTPVGESMLFKVYGTVTTPEGTWWGETTKVDWIRVSFRVGGDLVDRLDVAVQMLNRPEVSVP